MDLTPFSPLIVGLCGFGVGFALNPAKVLHSSAHSALSDFSFALGMSPRFAFATAIGVAFTIFAQVVIS